MEFTSKGPDAYIGSGREIYYKHPEKFDWCNESIRELAECCSRIPRAHGIYAYSILQHQRFCADLVVPFREKGFIAAKGPKTEELQQIMLIHDLHEGIISDIPSPLKPYIGIANIEVNWMRAIDQYFGLNRWKGINSTKPNLFQMEKIIDKVAFYYEAKIFAPLLSKKIAPMFVEYESSREFILEHIEQSNDIDSYLEQIGISNGINNRTGRYRKATQEKV